MATIPALAHGRGARPTGLRPTASLLVFALTLCFPSAARASFLSPELEDKLAGFIALAVIFVVPVVLIVLFWMVHILPEKIAHKRHHPQFEAIRTLCLLSLVFGGLLVAVGVAVGLLETGHVQDGLRHGQGRHDEGESPSDEAAQAATLKDRIARLEERASPADLQALRADVDALEAKFARDEVR